MRVYVVKVDEYMDGCKIVNEVRVFSNREEAKSWFNDVVSGERHNGREGIESESEEEGFFEKWVDGEYSLNHTTIEVIETELE